MPGGGWGELQRWARPMSRSLLNYFLRGIGAPVGKALGWCRLTWERIS